MESKTTTIGHDKWHPLEVEWIVDKPYVRQSDGSLKQVEEHKVMLVVPGSRFLTDEVRRVPLIGISPQTALNLLAWLQQEQGTLEKLAREQEVQVQANK